MCEFVSSLGDINQLRLATSFNLSSPLSSAALKCFPHTSKRDHSLVRYSWICQCANVAKKRTRRHNQEPVLVHECFGLLLDSGRSLSRISARYAWLTATFRNKPAFPTFVVDTLFPSACASLTTSLPRLAAMELGLQCFWSF